RGGCGHGGRGFDPLNLPHCQDDDGGGRPRCGRVAGCRGMPGVDCEPPGEGVTVALPYYASPEQMMADKAEYAKKGIAKGRSIVAMEHADGILLVADNPSASLHKISEMYDR